MNYNFIDYKEKYFKYKKKYLQLKNNIHGGVINPTDIDKFRIAMLHGSLNVDEFIIVPNNVYLIQSNTCGLSNFEDVYNLIKNKSIKELISFFEKTPQYSIINPNTEICDIKLSGYKDDMTSWGIFDFISNTPHYKIVIDSNTNEKIKDRMSNFMIKYNSDYKNKLRKLKNNYWFDILNNYVSPECFDILYLICFIKYLQNKISDSDKKGILSKDIIILNDKLKLKFIPNYLEYNKELSLKSFDDLQLFEKINGVIQSQSTNNIVDEINQLYISYQKDLVIDISQINLFKNRQMIENREVQDDLEDEQGFQYLDIKRNFTYFELFMIIFSYVFLEYNNNNKYQLNLSDVLTKLSENTREGKSSIIYSTACLGIDESQQSKDDLFKLQTCQNKLSGIKSTDILQKISDRSNIYNILLDTPANIFNILNNIADSKYNRNEYTNNEETIIIFDPKIVWLICVIDILFFTNHIQYIIDFINNYKIGKILYSSIPPFYKLIFIVFFEGNKNINKNIIYEFGGLQNDISIYLESESESESEALQKLKNNISEHISKIEDQNRYLKQEYLLLKYLIVYSINYTFINKILNFTKVKDKTIDDLLLKINNSKDGFTYFNIKKEYLIDKIKDKKEFRDGYPLDLYIVKFIFNKFNIELIKIFPAGNNYDNNDYMYILQEEYNEIIKNIFTLYLTL
jgi:hypothetical protein